MRLKDHSLRVNRRTNVHNGIRCLAFRTPPVSVVLWVRVRVTFKDTYCVRFSLLLLCRLYNKATESHFHDIVWVLMRQQRDLLDVLVDAEDIMGLVKGCNLMLFEHEKPRIFLHITREDHGRFNVKFDEPVIIITLRYAYLSRTPSTHPWFMHDRYNF